MPCGVVHPLVFKLLVSTVSLTGDHWWIAAGGSVRSKVEQLPPIVPVRWSVNRRVLCEDERETVGVLVR